MIVGDPNLGRVELFEIPPESESEPGLAVLSFAVRDLQAVIRACEERGIAVTEPAAMDAGGDGFTVAFASIGGLPFEFISFAGTAAPPEPSRSAAEAPSPEPSPRALPRPSELTETFWSTCRDRVLLVQRCTACRRCFFAPEVACIHCFSVDWERVRSAGLGELYSFSVVSRAGPIPPSRFPMSWASWNSTRATP